MAQADPALVPQRGRRAAVHAPTAPKPAPAPVHAAGRGHGDGPDSALVPQRGGRAETRASAAPKPAPAPVATTGRAAIIPNPLFCFALRCAPALVRSDPPSSQGFRSHARARQGRGEGGHWRSRPPPVFSQSKLDPPRKRFLRLTPPATGRGATGRGSLATCWDVEPNPGPAATDPREAPR